MKVLFSNPINMVSGSVIVIAREGCILGQRAKALDNKMHKVISRAMNASQFQGKKKQKLCILAPGDTKLDRIFVFGVGKENDLGQKIAEDTGGVMFEALATDGVKSAYLYLDDFGKDSFKAEDFAAHLAFGFLLSSYRFDKYKTNKNSKPKPKIQSISVQLSKVTKARAKFKSLEKTKDGYKRRCIFDQGSCFRAAKFTLSSVFG